MQKLIKFLCSPKGEHTVAALSVRLSVRSHEHIHKWLEIRILILTVDRGV